MSQTVYGPARAYWLTCRVPDEGIIEEVVGREISGQCVDGSPWRRLDVSSGPNRYLAKDCLILENAYWPSLDAAREEARRIQALEAKRIRAELERVLAWDFGGIFDLPGGAA